MGNTQQQQGFINPNDQKQQQNYPLTNNNNNNINNNNQQQPYLQQQYKNVNNYTNNNNPIPINNQASYGMYPTPAATATATTVTSVSSSTPLSSSAPIAIVNNNNNNNNNPVLIDFGDKVVVSYNFWKDNVDQLERSKQQQLGILLFANLFKRQPLCRQLFQDSDISKQALRLLDMFGWLLRSLIKEKNKMRVRTLKSLGDRHVKYGIKLEFFSPMLDSLSDALTEWFSNTYNSQIRVALKSLFQTACNEMMKQSGQKAPFARIDIQNSNTNNPNPNSSNISYRWLRSLDHCLADPMGLSALEQYLRKIYCSELTEFHKAYRIYRACLTPRVRKDVAVEICKLFLTSSAQFELNDSSDNRKKIYSIIAKCDELQLDLPIDIFDETHVWVKFQISQNAWMKFKIMIQSTK